MNSCVWKYLKYQLHSTNDLHASVCHFQVGFMGVADLTLSYLSPKCTPSAPHSSQETAPLEPPAQIMAQSIGKWPAMASHTLTISDSQIYIDIYRYNNNNNK